MDGSHLADFFLEKGYTVYGLERRSSGKTEIMSLILKIKLNLLKEI
jgi:GDP-D-mannose dehydratase